MTLFTNPSTRRFRLAGWLSIPVLALGLVLATDAPRADAGGFSFSIGSPGIYGFGSPIRSGVTRYGTGYRGVTYGHHGFNSGFGYSSGFRGYSSGFRGYSPYRSYYPRAQHFDYRAPVLVPHRNQFYYAPRSRSFYRGRH